MASNPDEYPYNTIAFITDTIAGQSWQASGVLISPDEVLTASHVVYSSTNGAASNVTVRLGYNQGSVGVGSATAAYFHYNSIQDPGNLLTLQQSQIDYAVIHLSTPFTGVGTMGLQPDFSGGAVFVSGYPAVQGGEQESNPEFVTRASNLSVLEGTSIGAGSSGGPVWIVRSDGTPEVVGLVSTGVSGPGSEGFFTQISAAAFNQIEAWVAQDDSNSPKLAIVDTSDGQQLPAAPAAYTGPVSGLFSQYINITSDSLAISATSPGWFIHSGSGTDAITVNNGTNVLDGGTGSNFLTGGTGTDTFFVDDRGLSADIWDTINNFHAGDAATLWGVTQAGFSLAWADNQGASGFLGLTLHASVSGRPNAALTLSGFTLADMLNGRLSVSFGTDAATGSPYMYVAAHG